MRRRLESERNRIADVQVPHRAAGGLELLRLGDDVADGVGEAADAGGDADRSPDRHARYGSPRAGPGRKGLGLASRHSVGRPDSCAGGHRPHRSSCGCDAAAVDGRGASVRHRPTLQLRARRPRVEHAVVDVLGGTMRLRTSPHIAIEGALDHRSRTSEDLTARVRETPIQGSLLVFPVKAALAPYCSAGSAGTASRRTSSTRPARRCSPPRRSARAGTSVLARSCRSQARGALRRLPVSLRALRRCRGRQPADQHPAGLGGQARRIKARCGRPGWPSTSSNRSESDR